MAMSNFSTLVALWMFSPAESKIYATLRKLGESGGFQRAPSGVCFAEKDWDGRK